MSIILTDSFVSILNMNIIASYVIIFVLVARLFLKKAPTVLSYSLWTVVLFRLICPISFSSAWSFLSAIKATTLYIPTGIIAVKNSKVNAGVNSINSTINTSFPPVGTIESINPLYDIMFILSIIWIVGTVVMITYSLLSYFIFKRKVNTAMFIENNIYECGKISSPFVLGIINPKIFIPIGLSETEKHYIIQHEKVHINRLDYIIKPVSFLVVCVYWFNPLVWISFILMSKDMEMSCDEQVIKKMGNRIKKDYSTSLLSSALEKKMIGSTPLSFGENNSENRVKNILNYKTPKFWVSIVSTILVVFIGIGLMVNPKEVDIHKLTIKKVIELSRKGDDLSWEDFNNYNCQDIGSGLHIYEYLMDDTYKLLVGGTLEEKPLYINLVKNEEESIDIRYGDINEFINRKAPTKVTIEPTPATVSQGQSIGADMAELDYASNDIVIFHGYFGLYVYDLKKLKMVRSLDLLSINCQFTQGDAYCEVTVSHDGNIIQLHPMNSERMYVYTVSDHTLYETDYQAMKNPFNRHVPIEEVMNIELKDMGHYSYTAIPFGSLDYGYLYIYDATLSTLSYVRSDRMYQLFDF